MATDDRAGYIAGLRQLADALEAHPEVPLPYHGRGTALVIQLQWEDNAREVMAACARALPCDWAKRTWDSGSSAYLDLEGRIDGLQITVSAYRDQVCTRRVVGTEVREVEEEVTPAVTRRATKEVEVVEWDCAPVLGANGGAA